MSDINLKLAALSAGIKLNSSRAINEIKMLDIVPSTGYKNATIHNRIRISSTKLEKKTFKNMKEYLQYLNFYLNAAKENGSALIVFPQLCYLFPLTITSGGDAILKNITDIDFKNLKDYLINFEATIGQSLYEFYLNVFRTFAKEYQMAIAAGSAIVFENGKYYNRSFMFNENGDIIGTQDKLFLTEYEKRLGLTCGGEINVIKTSVGNISILNDNDCLFFETAKIAKQQGADIILSSHFSQNQRMNEKFHEALIWRCDEQSIYGIESSYKIDNIKTQASLIAPSKLTKDMSGVLSFGEAANSHTFSLNLSKLNQFDSYSSDKNQTLYKDYSKFVYFD